jgi:hypothetical protein
MRKIRYATLSVFAAAAVVSAAMLAGGATEAGSSGRCYTAELAAPVVLPDGSTHAPGTLRFCLTRLHSPIEAMHHTSMDGLAIGLFRSRIGVSEGIDDPPSAFFVFTQRGDGALELEGFARPRDDGLLTTYQVDTGRARVTTSWLLAKELGRDEDLILIAAN